ncbi:MAG: hypothetical protein ACYSW3_27075 [Planctomycetota bacterium]|jgi:hypothetical protein
MYELFYSTGGHGGPYLTEFEAKLSALRRLNGDHNEQWIAIKRRSDNCEIARLTRLHLNELHYAGRRISGVTIGA